MGIIDPIILLYFLYFGTKAPTFLYFDIKFGTYLGTEHSITDRFGPEVWYSPEDNVINSKFFSLVRLD